MIDYDDLRKKAEAVDPMDWSYFMTVFRRTAGHQDLRVVEAVQKDVAYIVATSPATTLRLLDIIAVAKGELSNMARWNDVAREALDKIANLEKE